MSTDPAALPYLCASCGCAYGSSLAALACAADDDDLRSQFTD